MTGFLGKHSAKVDDKGRLVIPSGIKSVVPADQMEFVIRKDMYSNCLEMYTKQEWANMSFLMTNSIWSAGTTLLMPEGITSLPLSSTFALCLPKKPVISTEFLVWQNYK